MKPYSFYIASPRVFYVEVRRLAKALREHAPGSRFEFDWTQDAPLAPTDAPYTLAARKDVATKCLNAVHDCDVFVLYIPTDDTNGCGCFVETGFALALHKPFITVGPGVSRTAFADLATSHCVYTRELPQAIEEALK